MLLTGTYNRVLDEKQRIAIPTHLRDALPCPPGSGLYVTPGTDGSLTLYTEAVFELLGQRLAQSPPTRQDVRAFSRMFYGQAHHVELDRHGRMRIPQDLAALAKLQKDVVLVGVQDHLEIWASEVWQSYLADKQAHFDEIAESAMSGDTAQTHP
jgi:MraZ protein